MPSRPITSSDAIGAQRVLRESIASTITEATTTIAHDSAPTRCSACNPVSGTRNAAAIAASVSSQPNSRTHGLIVGADLSSPA